ncbi:MAG: hypothetical protein WAU89_23405 [Candidatus Acidiferrales bacterium]
MPPEAATTTTDTAATTTAANGGNAAAAASTTQTAAAAPWYGDIADPELKGWVELKKFDSPASALKSAREAEKLLGVPKNELVRMPKADAKPEEWDTFYNTVGRPATPDDYKLEVPMGDDGDFAKAIAPILHKAGITGTQAKILNTAWNELMADTLTAGEQQTQQQSQADILNLKREWGNSYDRRVEMGQRAIRQFGSELGGTPDEQRDELLKLENYLGGSAKMIRLFAAIGSKLGESGFVEGDRTPGFEGITPAAAQARLDELKQDKAWVRARLSDSTGKGKEAKEEDALLRIVASGRQ